MATALAHALSRLEIHPPAPLPAWGPVLYFTFFSARTPCPCCRAHAAGHSTTSSSLGQSTDPELHVARCHALASPVY